MFFYFERDISLFEAKYGVIIKSNSSLEHFFFKFKIVPLKSMQNLYQKALRFA